MTNQHVDCDVIAGYVLRQSPFRLYAEIFSQTGLADVGSYDKSLLLKESKRACDICGDEALAFA